LERVPQVLPLQPAPESNQVTPRFWKSFVTVAVKACVPYPEGRDAVDGDTLTVTGKPTPLIERKAAKPAPQLSEGEIEAVAEAVPATACI
jgi:hypothetical protein